MAAFIFNWWFAELDGYVDRLRKTRVRLGQYIQYLDSDSMVKYVFPVPTKFQGERDCILAVDSSNFTIETDRIFRIIHANANHVHLISNFPREMGIYMVDGTFGIPTGNQIPFRQPGARYLFRIPTRIGPIARDCNQTYSDRWTIHLGLKPSERLGIVVETKYGAVHSFEMGHSIPKQLALFPDI